MKNEKKKCEQENWWQFVECHLLFYSFILNMFLFRKHLKSFRYCVFIHLYLRWLSGHRICLHWIPRKKVVRQTEILIYKIPFEWRKISDDIQSDYELLINSSNNRIIMRYRCPVWNQLILNNTVNHYCLYCPCLCYNSLLW